MWNCGYVLCVFFIIFCDLLLVATAATPMDWQGTYNDPVYGGNIALCVSATQTGVYYGQALFSNVGYMRGTIDATTFQWSGSFYTVGFEVKHGTFSVVLGTDGTTGKATLSGSFTELPNILYSITSTRQSSVVPDDFDCFRSDISLLSSTGNYDFTGAWYDPSSSVSPPMPYYLAIDTSVTPASSTGSYVYYYADGTPSPGVGTGTANLYGQVVSNNWYESGSTEGMDLLVAKNATYSYILWWYFSRMSDFDYSYVTDPSYFGRHAYTRNSSVSTSMAIQKSTDTMCYALWTSAAEQSCTTTSSIIVSDDDNNSDNNSALHHNILIAILVMVVLTFIAVTVTLFSVLSSNKKASLASQQQAIEMSTRV